MRYRLTVAYRGTRFHGWQRQLVPGDDTGADLPTVQNNLRLALTRVAGRPVNVVGSSRTDAGVHAEAQLAHADLDDPRVPTPNLLRAANARLPPDIRITSLAEAPPGFDAISSTVDKAYRYTFFDADIGDPFRTDLALYVGKRLDAGTMASAAACFVGEYDFASFAKPGHGRRSTVRTVTSAAVTREGNFVHFTTSGTGYLWHQVRIMAGTLMRIGLGHAGTTDVKAMLAARNRAAAGPTAPPHGLYLQWVRTTFD